jgi:thiol:disulfide interchange protein
MKTLVLLVLVTVLQGVAWSQEVSTADADTMANERARIANLRQQQEAQFDAQEYACQSQFVVNDCVKAVKKRRIAVLSDLKRQERRINDAQRRQRGAEQLQRSEEKAADNAQRQRENAEQPPSSSLEERQKAQDEKNLNHRRQASSGGDRPSAGKTAAPPAPQAREAYTEKQRALEQRRLERDKRLKEHGTTSPGLPVPP